MTTLLTEPRPPALCTHCGRDAAEPSTICGHCSRALVPWRIVPRDDPSDPVGVALMIAGFAAVLAIGRALALGSSVELPTHLGITGAGMVIARFVWLSRIDWEAEGGATATTLFGRLTRATGIGSSLLERTAPAHETLRGDVLYDGAGANRRALPAPFDGDAVEITVVASIMGALARGQLVLVEARPHEWERFGMFRTEAPIARGSTFAITLRSPISPDDDAVAALLLASFYPPVEGDYRGPPVHLRSEQIPPRGDRRTVSLPQIVRAAFPLGQKPAQTLRLALPRGPRTPDEADAARALLTKISKDERCGTWTDLRAALRVALSERAREELLRAN